VSKNPTASATLCDYWDATSALPRQIITLDEPSESRTIRLSPVERATVHCVVERPADVLDGNSLLHEAAYRLFLLQERGGLPYMSGHAIADLLNYVFWPAHPSKLARRGWVLLAALDAADLVRVTLSAEPLPSAPRSFRRMRLHERLDELSRVAFSLWNTSPERRRTEIR
jgi:hypothetical protein